MMPSSLHCPSALGASAVLAMSLITAPAVYSEEVKAPLRLTIRLDKSHYLVGDTMTVFLKVENIAKNPTLYPARLCGNYWSSFMFVSPEGNPEQRGSLGENFGLMRLWGPSYRTDQLRTIASLRFGETVEFALKGKIGMFAWPDNPYLGRPVITIEFLGSGASEEELWFKRVHPELSASGQRVPDKYYLASGFGSYTVHAEYAGFQMEQDATMFRDRPFKVLSNVVTVEIQQAWRAATP